MGYRHAASAIVGELLFMFYFQPFLPDSQHAQLSIYWWPFLAIELICGFLLSLGLNRRRFWVPTCLLLTLLVSHAIVIVFDTVEHNLFPFELLATTLLASPAYIGASIAAAVDDFRARRSQL